MDWWSMSMPMSMREDVMYRHIEVWVYSWMGDIMVSDFVPTVRTSEILEAIEHLIDKQSDLVAIASVDADTHEVVFSWDRVNGWTCRP